MLFGFGILATALLLSLVAAYYSVAGLTAIFSAAAIPVIIMGGSLELGKVVATVWLHNNWRRAPFLFKAYLVPAIAFLMLLTSMGIFGFLSKAHSDQSLVSGDSMAKVAIYDEKIKTARDNIDANRKALKQMDEAVDQVMGRSADEKGADKAVAIRRGQAKERSRLLSEIAAEQKTITQLSEERAPLAAEFRKVEAEVGPIKYIAALVYGDNPDATVLEKAVRLVIIMIVLVFDPLALTLILAANKQFEWARHGEGGWVHDKEDEQPDAAAKENTVQLDNEEATPPPPESSVSEAITNLEQELTDTRQLIDNMNSQILESEQNYFRMKAALKAAETQSTEQWAQQAEQAQALTDWKNKFDRLADRYKALKAVSTKEREVDQDRIRELETLIEELATLQAEVPVAEPTTDSVEPVNSPEVIRVAPGYISVDGKISADNTVDPSLLLQADNVPGQAAVAGFGSEFPASPNRGDVFLRVDVLPNKLYKWNGAQWIQIPKEATDILADDWRYIEYIAKAVAQGSLSLEDLSDYEQEQLNKYLTNGGAVG
jgi:hypothetical protein